MERFKAYLSNQNFILSVAAILIIILRFVPISFGDIYGDGAHYSFRSYGWFDWLGNGGQSTPFDWLGYVPTWALFSFHDAPPMVFLVQNIFFKFFGDSVFAARLPFVLAGVGSLLLVYFFLKKFYNAKVASIAILLFSIISYEIWAEHSIYLEGIEVFFITTSVIFGGFFLFKEQNKKYLCLWIISLSCALLTKYTALFLLPPAIIFGLMHREKLKQHLKSFLLSIAIFLILFLPVIVYNLEIYNLRGHFDMAISSMLDIDSADFGFVQNRAPSLNVLANTVGIISTLSANVSYPLLLLFGVSLILLMLKIRRSGLNNFESWILVNTLFLVVLFTFAGAVDRYASIFVPFLVIIISLGVSEGLELIKKEKIRRIFIGAIILIFTFELFYSFNTNFLKTPIGSSGFWYSNNKIDNFGFNQLNQFIRTKVILRLPPKNSIRDKKDIDFDGEDIKNRSIVVYDDRIDWFAQMWYMQKYLLYYRWPIMSTAYFPNGAQSFETMREFLQISGQPMYFVYPLNSNVIDSMRKNDAALNYSGPEIAEKLEAMSVPSEIIKNESGVPVFKIYKITNL